MSASGSGDLSARLDAVVQEAQQRVKAFQAKAESNREGVQQRFQKFLPIADRIVAIVREKLKRLGERVKFEIIPAELKTDRFYSRSVTLDLKSELAGVARLKFQLSNDSDVQNILLDYNLEIVPVYFRFNPHSRLVMPLDAYDEAAVSKWLDDRVVEFAHAYMELHTTKQYQERAMVSDPVAGVSFPKFFAAATLEHDGKTQYFISEETRREYAKEHGLTR